MQSLRQWVLQVDSESVYKVMSDLSAFAALHPLLLAVDELDSGDEFKRYRITEKPFSFLPLKIGYNAVVYLEGPRYEITGLPLLKAMLTYDLEQTGIAATAVGLSLEISGGFSFLQRVLACKMLSAQDVVMKGLEVRALEEVGKARGY